MLMLLTLKLSLNKFCTTTCFNKLKYKKNHSQEQHLSNIILWSLCLVYEWKPHNSFLYVEYIFEANNETISCVYYVDILYNVFIQDKYSINILIFKDRNVQVSIHK